MALSSGEFRHPPLRVPPHNEYAPQTPLGIGPSQVAGIGLCLAGWRLANTSWFGLRERG